VEDEAMDVESEIRVGVDEVVDGDEAGGMLVTWVEEIVEFLFMPNADAGAGGGAVRNGRALELRTGGGVDVSVGLAVARLVRCVLVAALIAAVRRSDGAIAAPSALATWAGDSGSSVGTDEVRVGASTGVVDGLSGGENGAHCVSPGISGR
jgi:hypothetical protein